MRFTIFVATVAMLLWGAPAFSGSNPDFDLDGVGDAIDNCSEAANPNQDDTDADDCGNLCDADYNQDGNVGFGDFGEFTGVGFGTTNALYNHTEPVTDTVGFGDFGFYTQAFGGTPGPSGTTAGTIACP